MEGIRPDLNERHFVLIADVSPEKAVDFLAQLKMKVPPLQQWTDERLFWVDGSKSIPELHPIKADEAAALEQKYGTGERYGLTALKETLDSLLKSIKSVPWDLRFLPDRFKTHGMCRRAVEMSPSAIRFVPEKFMDKALCEKAVQAEPAALRSIPEKFVTSQMCREVFEAVPLLISCIPDKYRDKVVEEAISKRSGQSAFDMLKGLKPGDFTPAIAQAACRKDIRCLALIPDAVRFPLRDRLKPQEIADIRRIVGEKVSGCTYPGLPSRRKTAAVTMAAVLRDAECLRHVPTNKLNAKLIAAAVDSGQPVLAHIPERWKTEAMCQRAAERNIQNINGMPGDFITREIAEKAVEKDGNNICYVPGHILSQELCFKAIDRSLYNEDCPMDSILWNIPARQTTPEVCLYAVKHDARNMSDVPEGIRSGRNIFSLGKELDRLLSKPLSFDQIKRIHDGQPMTVTNRLNHKCELRYDSANGQISIKPQEHKQTQAVKPEVKKTKIKM